MPLKTELAIADADRFYARLVAELDDMDETEAAEFLGALVLSLANHVGDPGVLDEAVRLARAALTRRSNPTIDPDT